ncbi:hypothetical protein SprV_0301142400 [Sparganum proliferum]
MIGTLGPKMTDEADPRVDAGDSGSFKDFCIRDLVLSSQSQYSAKAIVMEVAEFPGMVRMDGPGLRTAQKCRQDDGLMHLQFGVHFNAVAIPRGGLQPAKAWLVLGSQRATSSSMAVLHESVLPR